MAPIRIGFIGLSSRGWASTNLVPQLFHPLLSSSYSLTALSTSSEASAASAAAKYSELAGHPVKGYHGEQGFVDIANDPNVDMVAVSIKVPDHLKAVTLLLKQIAEAAKRKGVRVLVGAQATHGVYLNKVKELIDSGKIGRVLSTSVILSAPTEMPFGGLTSEVYSYTADIHNGATLLTIPVGHFLVAVSHAIGEFTEVTASGAIQYPIALLRDSDGKFTGDSVPKTAHDQLSLSGIIRGSGNNTNAVFANIHIQGGIPLLGEKGRGRTALKWIIDGEDGVIEVLKKEDDTPALAFISTVEKRVLLNGGEVELEEREEDQLENAGKAWLEFARGGRYWSIEDAVRVHRVLDAAQRSIAEGKKFVLQ
ncbi:hypothetical protein EW026_g4012 [Hermanssonia centrifuga]|uniref:Gal80p-like C-terminal domain-containing protein n=1 Tax=Hermanssonia centrifuga TaxID=98765 RepID=A0A4S4KJJ6_9APHY|nr:hypothetical protein EW026_g4012 [Hermanssonia centrifuga]